MDKSSSARQAPPAFTDAAARVANALQKLAHASSVQYGGDCHLHAVLGKVLMQDLGFECRVVVGQAAWRVGDGDGDVLSHLADAQGWAPNGMAALGYHVWLQWGEFIVDFSSYQLPEKARQLDQADGGHTNVEWAPDHLILHRSEVRSFRDVQQLHKGLSFYYPDSRLEKRVMSGFVLEESTVATARFIMEHPHIRVFGRQTASRLFPAQPQQRPPAAPLMAHVA